MLRLPVSNPYIKGVNPVSEHQKCFAELLFWITKGTFETLIHRRIKGEKSVREEAILKSTTEKTGGGIKNFRANKKP